MAGDVRTNPQKAVLLQKLRAKLDTEVTRHLFDIVDTRAIGNETTPVEEARLRKVVERVATKTLTRDRCGGFTAQQREEVVDTLVEERLGLGPLSFLLEDRSVSGIMVNGPSAIYVERDGKVEQTGFKFHDREELMGVIERAFSAVGRRVSEAEPYGESRLADGSRINVIITPVALDGPYVTIRKISHALFSMERLVRMESITRETGRFLQQCVRGRLNLVISGLASSGKTTLLNVLSYAIPWRERIVVIENTAELRFPHGHVVRLEAKPPTFEGRGSVTIQDLLENALHMSSDRILVGELRGDEAFDMLQAMHTGHDGLMTTVHANDPLDALDRVSTLALMSSTHLSPIVVERQVRSAIDLIVHLERFEDDGSRRVSHISEVRHDTPETPLRELFVAGGRDHLTGRQLLPTGARPAFLERLARRGIEIPGHIFEVFRGKTGGVLNSAA